MWDVLSARARQCAKQPVWVRGHFFGSWWLLQSFSVGWHVMQQKQFLCGAIMEMPAYPPTFHIIPGVSKPLMPCHWRIQGNESVLCLACLRDLKNKVLAIP